MTSSRINRIDDEGGKRKHKATSDICFDFYHKALRLVAQWLLGQEFHKGQRRRLVC